MTGQWKYTIKMVLAAAVILVFPHLFIQFVGDNPMEVKETATRSIAIVNEDAGAPEAENLKLSEKVPAILEEKSDYKWTVLGRSAAENGLKNNEYDAVVFIPSDFTNNLLTYDDQQPAKADFQYKVQSQLNAVNKEKLLRELDYAANRVNTKMSSLYWNYVSEDMDDVRKEFDRILEKEIAFQTVMVNFYKPSSKNLAGELERQKGLLEDLKASMQQGVETSPERAGTVEEFEQNLASFVNYVDAYKEYQNGQQELLGVAQEESMLAIEAGTQSLALQQEELRQVFNEQGAMFSGAMTGVEEQLNKNAEAVGVLLEKRYNNAERQMAEMKDVHGSFLDEYKLASMTLLENDLISAREKITDSGQGGQPVEETPKDPEQANLTSELAKLELMRTELAKVLTSAKAVPDPKSAELISSISYLEKLDKEIQDLSGEIGVKGKSWKDVTIEYNNLLSKYSALSTNVVNNNGASHQIRNLILKKEQELLLSPQLPEDRKLRLIQAFSTPLKNGSVDSMISYYGFLAEYEVAANRLNQADAAKDSVLNNENLVKKVSGVLRADEEEQALWESLQFSLPQTQEVMVDMERNFDLFTIDYNLTLDEQQAAIINDVSVMEESANKVLSQLQEMQSGIGEVAPSQDMDGTSVLTQQQSIGQEMIYINELMKTLGERQNYVVNYTGELQKKVTTVQSDADVLNEKWATNVASTKLVRDDVFNVLGNTKVDGQNNGYVYDYLANPLQISGDTPAEKEKTVPPVVILVIVLISALLIGFFTHYFSSLPMLVKGALFVLLNLIVGLVISLFGLEIYSLSESKAIQWSIYTILLLTAASALVKTAFYFGNAAGWLASVGLILFFVSPLLALAAPNFLYEDPMSAVYMSIQYETDNQFAQGSFVLIGIIALLTIIPFAAEAFTKSKKPADTDQAYEAY
ncbi:type VII secretion protein EsaA [Fictibacillus iocasae]|uniref:Type VII secretion protein EsaA n=1 Tax=Fictibacillus iocasae TaxID=2715437 RepID=A0ABW2NUH3_9BACL